MRYWNDHGMNGWGIGLMTVAVLLLAALVVLGVIALVTYGGRASRQHPPVPPVPPAPPSPSGPSPGPQPERPTPEQVLADRLARGEIDPDEYRRRLEALRGDGGRPASP